MNSPTDPQLAIRLEGTVDDSERGASTITARRLHHDIIQKLQIKLKRTVRVADKNNKVNELPPGLGNFPIFNTKHYPNLPASVKAQSDFIFPVYRKFPCTRSY